MPLPPIKLSLSPQKRFSIALKYNANWTKHKQAQKNLTNQNFFVIVVAEEQYSKAIYCTVFQQIWLA